MSGNNLSQKELDNLYISYEKYGAEHLSEFIRAVWREAWDEAHDIGYKTGVAEGFNMGKREK